jgi:biotin carboxyl carrier protein
MAEPAVTRIEPGVYRVEHETRAEIVYVAGSTDNAWAFWNGHVFRGNAPAASSARRRPTVTDLAQSLTAPMPAVVRQVIAQPGAIVRKGEALIVLEAMKMELPIRAPTDGTVVAVHCREGELVQPDAPLVDLQ